MNQSEIECQIACQRLVVASYSLMDLGQYPETAALFCVDGMWLRGGKPYTGYEAILASLNERSPDDTSRHLITNVLVTQHGEDEAEATAMFVPLRGKHAEDGTVPMTPPAMIGQLAYQFRRELGAWKISALRPRPLFK